MFMLVEAPKQKLVSLLATTIGKALMLTVTESLLLQPLASVPVTIYLVEILGLADLTAPFPSPLFQVNVAAPLALIFAEDPIQIAVSLLAITLGKALMLTKTESILLQPFPSVPVTMYLVVMLGLTDLASLRPRLLFHK